MNSLLQNIRFGLRMLAKSPGFTAVAVLTLALGIGANTAIFTVADALLLRPLPYANPQRLTMVYETSITNRSEESVFSYPYFARLRDQQHSFSGISAFVGDDFDMTGRGEPRQISAGRVSWNFFDVLGVRPLLGRNFFASEGQRGSNRVLMLSHQFWISEFGGAPGVIGQSLMLDSLGYTIVGVLPANFVFAPLGNDTQVWIPREFELNIATPAHIQAGMGYLEGIARLAPGVSIEQAQSEMDVLHKEYCRDNPTRPDASPKWPSAVTPLQTMIVANIRAAVLILMGAVGVVLLIACANVASLLLSRALKRKKEMAVRTALGARRGAIVRQLLVESLLLATISGVIGIFAGYAGTRGLLALNHDTVSQLSGGIAMDWRVLCFTIAISLVSGVLFGLAPALQLSKTDLTSVLRDEGRGSTGSRRAASSQNLLVVAQVALSMILLIGSGLLIRSFLHLMNVNPGFDPRNVLTMRINLSPSKYGTNAQMVSFYNEVLRQMQSLPGVRAAAISSALPPTPTRFAPILAEGQPVVPLPQRPGVNIETISPDYAKVLRVPLERGREFTAEDNQTTPTVTMVNQAFVRRYWPDENPIGEHIWLGTIATPVEVVGVFGDEKNNGISREPAPEMLLPFPNLPWSHLRLSLRSAGGDPMALVPAVRQRLARIDSVQPITEVQTLEQILAQSRAQSKFTVALFGIFSGVALVLAIVGIYGVISYTVAQRMHEMGIRMALGADKRDIFRLVIGRGLRLAGIGIAIGLIAPFTLTRLMSSLLYKVSPADPLTIIGSAILFFAAALLASYIPARRASRTDPMAALRYE
ncbi:MAG TPA: ABC transporter permease [Candidatus Acidoferrales bacterium]|nr:ABC transporter permease [Candidatus Acidoferrales bacterium]